MRMNIYKYIKSKDVREYNEKIGHKFTTLESAFLVWRNTDITLKEKHDGWHEIMREMPDEEVSKRMNVDYAPSLFALLNQFIETDIALIEEFYKKDAGCVYSYRDYCKGDPSFTDDFGRIYTDFGYMQRTIEQGGGYDDTLLIEYTKKYLSSPFRDIVLTTDKSGNAMRVYGTFIQGYNPTVEKDEFFEGLWIDVPTPFRVGDILCSEKTPFGRRAYGEKEPFVLLSLGNWDSKTAKKRGERLSAKDAAWRDKHLKRLKECGDISDMYVSAYFLCSDYQDRFTGEFFAEVMDDYIDLEYYRGEFNGGERVLLPISYFVKKEINEEEFFKACKIIQKQEEVKRDIDCLGILDEWVKKLGIEK